MKKIIETIGLAMMVGIILTLFFRWITHAPMLDDNLTMIATGIFLWGAALWFVPHALEGGK
jgi:ABC-type tungstate transport system substrate-binding protein